MLTENQKQIFKEELNSRFLSLRGEISHELLRSDEQQYIDLAGEVHDLGEASLADLLVDLQLASIHRHVQEIRDIDAALLRIASGAYGRCSDCEISIKLERLQAYPTAKRCRPCQVVFEKTHVQERGSSL
jgi:DnaK suppressor protein